MNHVAGRHAVALAALAVAVLLAGCDRTPRLIPAGADSTATVPADSVAVHAQRARDLWDSPDGGPEAARLTARVLHELLRGAGDGALADRARHFADSLGFGAETAGRGAFVLVNLFARAQPAEGSWPWLFWRDGGQIRSQGLEASGLRLGGAVADPAGGIEGRPARIAVLFSRSGAAGPQPFAFVWRRAAGGGTWDLAQSLGPDSLGPTGTAQVQEPAADGAVFVSRTYRVARGFDECPACPHVHRTRRFRWGVGGLESVSDQLERSPYQGFVQFILALTSGTPEEAAILAADRSVVDAALAAGWHNPRGLWRLAPGSVPTARTLVMFRGSGEAWRVHFATRGGEWVVAGLEATTRTLE